MSIDEPRPNSPEDLGHRTPPPAVMPRLQRRRTDTMAKTTKEQPDDEEGFEGPRGFAPLLQQIDDGELHAELSSELQHLGRVCRDHALRFQRTARGKLVLTINLAAIGNTIQVTGEVKATPPKAKRGGSTFWLTPGGNLSVENPRQQKLPLREVPPSTTKTKDISNEAAPVRGV